MNWVRIAEIISDVLAIILIIRLYTLHLHSVYRVFCLFLISEIAFLSLITVAGRFLDTIPGYDYRVLWIISRVVAWTLSLWMVYALLHAILENLPGLRAFSRKLLTITLAFSIALGVVTGIPEYSAGGIANAVGIVFVLDRVIATTALLVLLSMLGFILWFPVEIPRNLARFSVGFVVYFAAKTVLLLTRSFWSHDSLRLVTNLIMFVLAGCYLYWTLALNGEGEAAPVRMGHSWHAGEQQRLVLQLEAINASLLRAARHQAS